MTQIGKKQLHLTSRARSKFEHNFMQGSTLTFQLTSLVASDNLDVTSQKKFLLAKW